MNGKRRGRKIDNTTIENVGQPHHRPRHLHLIRVINPMTPRRRHQTGHNPIIKIIQVPSPSSLTWPSIIQSAKECGHLSSLNGTNSSSLRLNTPSTS